MTDLLAVEAQEILGEDTPDDNAMPDARFRSLVSDMVEDAEQWIKNDISSERERAHRYYRGECDLVERNDQRSQFVMRVVRDCIEQTMPQLMKIFTGAEYLVSFKARDINEQQQSGAADATEAFHDVFWNKNEGWLNLQGFCRDALKAKTGIFKVFMKTETRVKEIEYQGTLQEFGVFAAPDNIDVIESRQWFQPVTDMIPIINMPITRQQPMVDATLRVRDEMRTICIETTPPEELLINRSATSTKYGYYNLIGQQSVKTVSDAVDMGIDFDTAVKHSGTGDGSATGDYPDQERRSRRSLSRDPYQEQVHGDPATKPLIIHELYVRVDKDGDGTAELRRVIGLGQNVAEIVEDEIVEDHPYCIGSAISVEHSVIGESMADNVMDLQDVDTQLSRNMLNNMGYVNNPRPIVADNVDLESLLDNRLGFPIKGNPGNVEWMQWPWVGDKILAVRESFNETKAERTGVTKESMGLAAKNLQASSEVGVLAILGAGLTQPEMIAANLAHAALVPLAKKVIKLLKENPEVASQILSKGTQQEVNPQQWPDDMDIKVRVGLGTGTREEKLAALNMLAAKQEQILQIAGPDNPICSMDQYARTLHQIAELSNLGQTTDFINAPEEVVQRIEQAKAEAANKPPKPTPEQEKLAAEAKKAQLSAQTDMQTTAMNNETAITVQAMKDRMDEMEMLLEASLAQMKAQQEPLTSSDVNIQQGGS